jgi:uncharacterized protein (TIGR00369 family)
VDLDRLMRIAPYHQWLGVELVGAEEGRVVVRLPFREEFVGDEASTNIHGGLISTLADITACFAVISAIGHDAPTLDLRIDYLRLARPGSELVAAGQVIKAGRTIGVADVEVRDDSDRLVAVARGTFLTSLLSRGVLSELSSSPGP